MGGHWSRRATQRRDRNGDSERPVISGLQISGTVIMAGSSVLAGSDAWKIRARVM